jgi:DNA-binding NarL/FixJ family response regulator
MGNFFSFWKSIQKRMGRQPKGSSLAVDLDTYDQLARIGKETNQTPSMVANAIIQNAIAKKETFDTTEQVWRGLSPDEQDVVALICLGYTSRQIASIMDIPMNTVEIHAKSVLIKFKVMDRNGLRRLFTGWDFRGWDRL